MYNNLIGLEVTSSIELLNSQGVSNIKPFSYFDKRQTNYDKEIVIAVRQRENYVELIVGRFQFAVSEK
ncbi:MAG: hypothetical protein RR086_05435 [Clostridia bacterium]